MDQRMTLFVSSLALFLALFVYQRYYSSSSSTSSSYVNEYDDEEEYTVGDKSIDGSEDDYIELED